MLTTTQRSPLFLRAGFDELVTHADLQKGRDATVFRKRREGGVPKAAPKPPAPPPAKPKAEVVPRWQRDYAEGRPVYSVARDSYPGGEPRDSS